MAGRTGRKRAAYRKKTQNRFSMFLALLVVAMLSVVVAVSSVRLHQRLQDYQARYDELQEKIEEQKERQAWLEEYEKYTQTKKYAEEVAKEKLGLVYEDEILFKERD